MIDKNVVVKEILVRVMGELALGTKLEDIAARAYEMGEAYEAAAFALDEYETSGVVEYGGGYYVIMRMPIRELDVLMNGEQLLQYYQSAKMGEYQDKIKENMTVELNEYGKSLDLVHLQ